MKLFFRNRIVLFSVVYCCVTLTAARTSAAILSWDGTGNSWNTASSWSTDQTAPTPDPASPPGASDLADFNITTVNTPQTVNLNANQSAQGLLVDSSGTVLIQSGSGTNTLAIGLGGIALVAPAGSVTISAPVSLTANQDWANDAVDPSHSLNVTNSVNLGANTLNILGRAPITLGGVLSGSGGLTVNGIEAFSLALNGPNTYNGITNISGGPVVLGNASALGAASTGASGTSITHGGTLDLGGQAIGMESITLSGTGVNDGGALVNNNATPASLAGTVILNSPSYIGGTGDMTLTGSVLDFPGTSLLTKVGNNTLTLSGTTDNTNLHVAVDSGTLVLAKTNDAHNALAIGFGGLTVSGGTAQLAGTGSDQIWDSTDVTVTSGAFDTNGRSETVRTLYLQGTGINGAGALVNSSATFSTILTPLNGTVLTGNTTIGAFLDGPYIGLQLNNAVSGNFALTKVGPGILVLNGTNSFSGGLAIQNGSLAFYDFINNAGTNGPLGNNTSVTLGSSGHTGTLISTGNSVPMTTNMPFILPAGGTGGFAATNLTLNGMISGGGGFLASQGDLTLGANNTFTGGVTINTSASVKLANAGALNAASPNAVTMNGGTLSLNGFSVSVGGLSTSNPAAIINNGGTGPSTLTVESSENNTFAGAIGAGSEYGITLRKIGPETLTLSGTVDNVGLAAVASGGTLILAKTSSSSPDVHAVGGGGLIVNGGAAQLAGTGDDQIWWGANVTVTSGTLDTNARNESMTSLALQGTGLAGRGALVNSAAGVSSITPTNGTTLTGNTTIGVTQSTGTLTLNNAISGNFALTKVGAGTLRLTNNSTFSGGFNLNQGKLLVKSPGAIGTGPLTIASTGTLGIEIDGAANPPSYDHVNVLGQLTLGGTLSIDLLNGFTPAAGNTFDILDWGTLIGTFSSLQLPTLASGLQWNTSQLYTTGTLSIVSAALTGDYNLNGTVDAADYIIYRNTLGQTGPGLAADGNNNGFIDTGDLDVWRAHFGQSAASATSNSAAIPEPSPMAMVLLMIPVFNSDRRRTI